MATITDFKEWLQGVDLDDYNDVYDLYCAVNSVADIGMFECLKKESDNSMYFVKSTTTDDVLLLASDKARNYFIDHLNTTFAGDLDIEGWYNFKHENEKDN